MSRTAAVFAFVSMIGATAYAHEGEAHGRHHVDSQMAALHKMMPRYSRSQERIDAALEKGDAVTVRKETGYLLSTAADLEKSKPHKHLAELKDYRSLAGKFQVEVRSTAESARKGDLKGAKVSFAAAKKTCSACHEKFRD